MRWFLDMCIILNYIGEGDNKSLATKAKYFIDNKNGKIFLVCYYIKDWNIPKWLNRKRIIFREVLRQIKDLSYKPYSDEECTYLFNQDKNQILKLVELSRSVSNIEELIDKFEGAYQEIESRINSFLSENVDEFIIPIKEIDSDLKSCLFTWLASNDSDARTIASAVQEHNNKALVILTSDKKDWTKELLENIHLDLKLKGKYKHLPEIKYLQTI